METRMQLVLGKNILEMIEFTENECLPNFKPKWKPLTLITTRKRIDIDFESISIVQKNRKRLVSPKWLLIQPKKKPIPHSSHCDSCVIAGFSREI